MIKQSKKPIALFSHCFDYRANDLKFTGVE